MTALAHDLTDDQLATACRRRRTRRSTTAGAPLGVAHDFADERLDGAPGAESDGAARRGAAGAPRPS